MRYISTGLMSVLGGLVSAALVSCAALDFPAAISHAHSIIIVALILVVLLMIVLMFSERAAFWSRNHWHRRSSGRRQTTIPDAKEPPA